MAQSKKESGFDGAGGVFRNHFFLLAFGVSSKTC